MWGDFFKSDKGGVFFLIFFMVFTQKHMPKIGGLFAFIRRAAPAAIKISSR
jgi:hypothetical protein